MYGRKKNYYDNNNKYYKKDKNRKFNNKSGKNIQLSKFLCLILRHKAKDFGLDIEPSGFVKLQDIIELPQSQRFHMSIETIEEIVKNDEKGRFELVNRPPYYIRTVQGHSMSEVTNDETLVKLTKDNIFDFPTVVHGTQEKAWNLIEKSGLNKMNRNAIHFSIGYNDENHVKSGMRLNCEVFIEINPQYAFFNGFDFFISVNNVILCPGNEQGTLPIIYAKKVKDKKGNILYSTDYDTFVKYKENKFEIYKENKLIETIGEPNALGDYLIEKELVKEKIIMVIEEKNEKNYVDMVKNGVEKYEIKYPALFVDYIFEDNNNFYSSESIKKVDINWKNFYEKKDYKYKDENKDDDKEEDDKEEI